ncbi:hypothetical protein DL96DRAFT_1564764 [Flagelloscypha sp. PMI_526]|nr:hypothetical protein DL96DRAFT_1564764 [Flagelloscypha sp. PMI_526]
MPARNDLRRTGRHRQAKYYASCREDILKRGRQAYCAKKVSKMKIDFRAKSSNTGAVICSSASDSLVDSQKMHKKARNAANYLENQTERRAKAMARVLDLRSQKASANETKRLEGIKRRAWQRMEKEVKEAQVVAQHQEQVLKQAALRDFLAKNTSASHHKQKDGRGSLPAIFEDDGSSSSSSNEDPWWDEADFEGFEDLSPAGAMSRVFLATEAGTSQQWWQPTLELCWERQVAATRPIRPLLDKLDGDNSFVNRPIPPVLVAVTEDLAVFASTKEIYATTRKYVIQQAQGTLDTIDHILDDVLPELYYRGNTTSYEHLDDVLPGLDECRSSSISYEDLKSLEHGLLKRRANIELKYTLFLLAQMPHDETWSHHLPSAHHGFEFTQALGDALRFVEKSDICTAALTVTELGDVSHRFQRDGRLQARMLASSQGRDFGLRCLRKLLDDSMVGINGGFTPSKKRVVIHFEE